MSHKGEESDGKKVKKNNRRVKVPGVTKLQVLDKLKVGVKPFELVSEFGLKYSTIMKIKYDETVIRAGGTVEAGGGGLVKQETVCSSSSDHHHRLYEHTNPRTQKHYSNRNLETEKYETIASTSGLQSRCKKKCPACSAIVHVRKYICQCGHNFLAEKEILKKRRDDKMEKAGLIAHKNGNLWRAFDAIKKQVL
ncbi:uncharacterized protein [Cherax quadricarinatus]